MIHPGTRSVEVNRKPQPNGIIVTEPHTHSSPVLIIGPGGIGAALARLCLARGQPVALIGRRGDAVATLAAQLGAEFGHAQPAPTTPYATPYATADVTDPAALTAAIAGLAAQTGGFGGLAYCVGSIALKPLKAMTAEDALAAFRLNALGAALSVQAAQPHLGQGSGIVLFSTVAVAQGFANHTIIGLAKGAVEGLMRSLAAELAPKLRVNAVAPSLTDTPLAKPLTGTEAMAKAIAQMHPIPRLGAAEDAAAAADFLLDDARSAWITGQVIHVDGGRSTLRTKG